MKRAFLAAAAAAFLLHFTDDRLDAQAPDDLKFFKNYGKEARAFVGIPIRHVDDNSSRSTKFPVRRV